MFEYYDYLSECFERLGVTTEYEEEMKGKIEDIWRDEMRGPDPANPFIAFGLTLD